MNRNHDAAAGIRAMLSDIEQEVAYTRSEIGKDALDPRVITAMGRVPRERFIPEPLRYSAFHNGPVPIGHGQTISQPYIVALMTDLLAPQAESVILEVGTGSGYQAAVLAEVVRHVYTIEIIGALAESARARLRKLGYGNVTVKHGDGWHGWPEHGPFDGILVAAAAPEIPPPLIEQFKPGARLVIPVGEAGSVQELKLIEKRPDGSLDTRHILLVAFVPLTREEAPESGRGLQL